MSSLPSQSNDEIFSKVSVGISSCLLGERVRFDGGHKNNAYIVKTLGEFFEFKQFCPEVAIGLGIPRETIRLVLRGDETRCVGTKNPELDVTEKLLDIGEAQSHWLAELSGYIFKKDSPSCGMERVKVYRGEMPERKGVGLYASVVKKNFPHLPVEEEGRLGDAHLRENFVKRVYIYDRWRLLENSNAKAKGYVEFHAQHKLIYMSHSQSKTRELGQLVAKISDATVESFKKDYIALVTNILAKPATRKNHVNVLQHIQGYLKRELDKDDKKELNETIEQYRLGLLPLIVPITILKHHFRKCPSEYIENSYYMQPHPSELMLRNVL